jgi:hypothetical protein
MASFTALSARVSALVAGTQPSAPVGDPLVLTSTLNSSIANKLDRTGDGSLLTGVVKSVGGVAKSNLTLDDIGAAPALVRRYNTIDRPVTAVAKEVVITPADLGVAGDASTDAAPALQTAFDYYAARGGARIRLPGAYLIDTNVYAKNSITIAGDTGLHGMIARFLKTDAERAKTFSETGAIHRDNPYSDVQRIYTDPNAFANRLVVNPSATVSLGTGSGIDGLMIIRKGFSSIPQGGSTPSNTGSEAYSGVAITGKGDGVTIEDIFAVGFDHVFKSDGFQQIRTARIMFDCLNGFWVNDAQDVCLYDAWHGFPWATIGSGTAYLTRPGYVGRVSNSVDWSVWSRCFGYGYKTAYVVENSQSARFLDCSADSVPNSSVADVQVMQSAFTITNSDHCRIVGGHVSGGALHMVDMNIAEYGRLQHHVSVVGLCGATLTGAAYNVQSGSLSVVGGHVANAPILIKTLLPTSRVLLSGIATRQITDVPFDVADTSQLQFENIDFGDWLETKSLFRKTPLSGDRAIIYGRETVSISGILSAGWRQGRVATLTVTGPADGSGSNGYMAGAYPGRRVRLYAANSFTLYGGDTGGMGFAFAAGGSSLAVPAGSWVEFEHDGSVWRQVKL